VEQTAARQCVGGRILKHVMRRVLGRLLDWLGSWRRPLPPESRPDPHAWRPAPLRPQPKDRSGAVAVAEPEDP
jgi:hypothetical protein